MHTRRRIRNRYTRTSHQVSQHGKTLTFNSQKIQRMKTKNEGKKKNMRTLMENLTSTASILYITKHASFIRNLNHLANRS